MKFMIFKMFIMLGILLALPMIYMGKFNPMALFESGSVAGVTDFKQLQAKAPKNLSSVVTDKKVEVYKWRDENGVMQFSNKPPTAAKAEQVVLNPNKNIIQAVKVPVKEEEKAVVKHEAPNPYSFKGMKNAVNDAKGVEEMLQKRHEQQMKSLGNI